MGQMELNLFTMEEAFKEEREINQQLKEKIREFEEEFRKWQDKELSKSFQLSDFYIESQNDTVKKQEVVPEVISSIKKKEIFANSENYSFLEKKEYEVHTPDSKLKEDLYASIAGEDSSFSGINLEEMLSKLKDDVSNLKSLSDKLDTQRKVREKVVR